MSKKTTGRHRPPRRTLHSERFPGEGDQYRAARDELLRAEIDLRRRIEAVSALRRKLPLGGAVPQDYEFEEPTGPVKLSELFAPGKGTLVTYNFMYSPQMEHACPACTSLLDSLDGAAPHITQRVNLAIVAKSPIGRIREFAQERRWRHLRLVSSANNSFNGDYHGETAEGAQMPMLNVFQKRGRQIRHIYATELRLLPGDKGQGTRHVDAIWPLWNVFDLTPDGRGAKWSPKLSYE